MSERIHTYKQAIEKLVNRFYFKQQKNYFKSPEDEQTEAQIINTLSTTITLQREQLRALRLKNFIAENKAEISKIKVTPEEATLIQKQVNEYDFSKLENVLKAVKEHEQLKEFLKTEN